MKKLLKVKGLKLNRVQKVAMGLSLMLLLVGIIIMPSALASPVSVKSVTITSERLDYNKKEEGSFKIDKQAEWTSLGKARITFNLDTVIKK